MSGDAILVLNAGSSSLKFSVFRTRDADLDLVVRGEVERLDARRHVTVRDGHGATVVERDLPPGDDDTIAIVGTYLRERHGGERLVAVGHRVVHGGAELTEPVRVDARVLDALERLVPLAPLHQPHNLAAI